MKIYKLCFDVDNYENIETCQEVSVDFYQMFDGTSLKGKWRSLKVKRMEPEKGLKLGDAPGFTIPVFGKKAMDILYPLLKEDVEILPMQFEGGELYGINVLTVLDALDYDLSEYRTFRDGKRILAIQKYAFKPNVIKGKNIFKIENEKHRAPFVSEEFYNAVIDGGLEGFKLELVYDV